MIRANEALWDRTLRVGIGGVLLTLGWGGAFGAWVSLPIAVLGVAVLVAGVRGWCPVYAALGVSTMRDPRAGAGKP
jgi:hypothetical protein